jgi:hypothetical protein
MMALKINLAKTPFGNRRLLAVGFVAAILMGGFLAVEFNEALGISEQQRQVVLNELNRQERQIAALKARIPPPVTPDLLKAEERELLAEASVLVERRVFRWSNLLDDLEQQLGNDVRLTSVSVALDDVSRIDALHPGTAPVEVSMIVVGRQLQNVLDAERSLRATGRFSNVRPRKQTVLDGTQEIEYELDVTYSP